MKQTVKEQMEKIYGEMSPEEIPWNLETPPDMLAALVSGGLLPRSRVIEYGCGAGNSVVYFAKNGFDATGIDISENAIRLARRSAERAGVRCSFVVADVLGEIPELTTGFDFAYDWELLHHIFPEDREKYIGNVWRLLKPGGLYLSVSFSERSRQFGGVGKYRKTPLGTVLYFSSESELDLLLRKRFVVEELKTVDIPGKHAIHTAVYVRCRKENG